MNIENLEPLPVTSYNNGGKLYIYNENELAKIFEEDNQFIKQREETTNILLDQKIIENSSYPMSKIEKNGIYVGYTMPYIKDACTFKKGVNNKNLTTEQKIKFLKETSMALNEFHNKDLILRDIHLDNFIYNNEHAYIIDLDEVSYEDSDNYVLTLYNLRTERETLPIMDDNKCVDNIKAIICFSSFLFSHNFERLAMYGSLEEVIELLVESVDNKKFQEFINYNLRNFHDSPSYFHEVIEEINDPEKIKFYKKNINNNFQNMI